MTSCIACAGQIASPRHPGDEAATRRFSSAAEQSRESDPPSALNDRDVALLRHLADGKSTARTAAAMSVTTNTVRTRMRRVRDKLAAEDRDDALSIAREIGIV